MYCGCASICPSIRGLPIHPFSRPLSINPSIHLTFHYPSNHLKIDQSPHLSMVYPSINITIHYPSIYTSIYPFVYLPIHPWSKSPSINLSIHSSNQPFIHPFSAYLGLVVKAMTKAGRPGSFFFLVPLFQPFQEEVGGVWWWWAGRGLSS